MTKENRIAFFISRYALGMSASIVNSAIVLAKNGYFVDIFLYHVGDYSKMASFKDPRIQVYDLTESSVFPIPPVVSHPIVILKRSVKAVLKHVVPENVRAQLDLLRSKLRAKVTLSQEAEFAIIPKMVFLKAAEVMANKQYLCFFGMESQGIIFAGRLGAKFGVPVIYFSMELYLSDHPHFSDNPDFETWKRLERKYHQQAVATIIQDEERSKLLFEDNRISQNSHNVFFVPVGMLGGPIRTRYRYFHQRFGLPENERLILQLGYIHRFRKSLEVAQAAQQLPPGWTLIMHGLLDSRIKDAIKRYDTGKRVILSVDTVPFEKLQMLVASTDVGLVFYIDDNLNDYTTGHASDKMARYLQCGLPVITNDFPSFKRIIDTYNCGVYVHTPSELNCALLNIDANYELYRDAAYACHMTEYEFSKHFDPILEFLKKL